MRRGGVRIVEPFIAWELDTFISMIGSLHIKKRYMRREGVRIARVIHN
jgi:hypothetical protein